MTSSHGLKLPILLGVVVTLAGLSFLRPKRKEATNPYPPGPSGLPIIGSVLKLNLNEPHLTYTEWAKQYGEVVYSRILGDDVILVNTERAVRALAEGQRSAIYASRPQIPLIKRFGVDFHTATTPYGPEWRAHRTIIQQVLRADSVLKYRDLFMTQSPSSRLTSSFMYGNFGFGRRACPGRVYADNLLWAAVVQILATLTRVA